MSILTHVVRQSWLVLAVLAPVWFLVVDVGRVLQRAPLPESLSDVPSWQHRVAPLLGNAVLLLAAFLLAMTLPRLVRRRTHGAPGLVAAFSGIVLLGTVLLRVARPDAALIPITSLILCVLLAAAAISTFRGPAMARPRIIAGLLLGALLLPHAQRLAHEILRDPEAGAVAGLRLTSAALVATTLSLTTFMLPVRRPDVLALVPALGAAVAMAMKFETAREILTDVSGLWLTTLPQAMLMVAVPTALFGVLRLLLHSVMDGRGKGLALGVLFLVTAGFLPTRPEQVLLAAVGACAITRWARGEGETLEALS